MRTATAAVLAGFAAITLTATPSSPVPTPVASSTHAVCDTDTACAWHDTRVAQGGYGVPVYAGTPGVTPYVSEARHGQYVELSCDTGRELVDTADGWACVAPPVQSA